MSTRLAVIGGDGIGPEVVAEGLKVLHAVLPGVDATQYDLGANAYRRTGEALSSRALVADAKQTYACWSLSAVTLAGLALNALLGWWWADPVAGLGIAVLLVREGIEAVRGEEEDDPAPP